jgi:hypothetical protein
MHLSVNLLNSAKLNSSSTSPIITLTVPLLFSETDIFFMRRIVQPSPLVKRPDFLGVRYGTMLPERLCVTE